MISSHDADEPGTMVRAACTPLPTLSPIADGEQHPDRLAELLECLADLLVETGRQRAELTQHYGSSPQAQDAIVRLAEVERSLGTVGAEAASVHQLLQHLHLT